jgi:PIN domain nuclease of toxin-antitoxin system
LTSSTETTRPAYVVDTHAPIWYLTRDKKLGSRASTIFAAAEQGETQIVISAIVVAELFYANEKWRLFSDFPAAFYDLLSKPCFQFIPFTARDVLDFVTDQGVREMHDRIITGLARRLGIPLIASDPDIVAAGLAEIAW